jgi:hypothetical protein
LEGVVSALHRSLRLDDQEFRCERREDKLRGVSLCDQIRDLRRDAERRKRKSLPYLDLKLKFFRDILAHPSITKSVSPPVQFRSFPGGQKDVRLLDAHILSEFDLYSLTAADVEADGTIIDRWLNQLCELYQYPRFPDTKQALEEALRPYGGDSTAVHKI